LKPSLVAIRSLNGSRRLRGGISVDVIGDCGCRGMACRCPRCRCGHVRDRLDGADRFTDHAPIFMNDVAGDLDLQFVHLLGLFRCDPGGQQQAIICGSSSGPCRRYSESPSRRGLGRSGDERYSLNGIGPCWSIGSSGPETTGRRRCRLCRRRLATKTCLGRG
jgi:hypothetical protein